MICTWTRQEDGTAREVRHPGNGTTKERVLDPEEPRIGGIRQPKTMNRLGTHSKEIRHRLTTGEESRKGTLRHLQKAKDNGRLDHVAETVRLVELLGTGQRSAQHMARDSKESATTVISRDTARGIALWIKAKAREARKEKEANDGQKGENEVYMDSGKRRTAGNGRQRNRRRKVQAYHRKWEKPRMMHNDWAFSRNVTDVRKKGVAGGGTSPTKGKGRACAWVQTISALGN